MWTRSHWEKEHMRQELLGHDCIILTRIDLRNGFHRIEFICGLLPKPASPVGELMLRQFDTMKAIQAAAVLLRFDDGAMDYLRLLKLLYIADREALRETGRPISYSRTIAMDNGPLSSEVY